MPATKLSDEPVVGLAESRLQCKTIDKGEGNDSSSVVLVHRIPAHQLVKLSEVA